MNYVFPLCNYWFLMPGRYKNIQNHVVRNTISIDLHTTSTYSIGGGKGESVAGSECATFFGSLFTTSLFYPRATKTESRPQIYFLKTWE